MTIEDIELQIQSLNDERTARLADLQRIAGAMQMCEHWSATLRERERLAAEANAAMEELKAIRSESLPVCSESAG